MLKHLFIGIVKCALLIQKHSAVFTQKKIKTKEIRQRNEKNRWCSEQNIAVRNNVTLISIFTES